MASDRNRQPFTVRLSDEGRERVQELAAQETEGNASQMIRKLLSEAIAARDRKAQIASQPPTPPRKGTYP